MLHNGSNNALFIGEFYYILRVFVNATASFANLLYIHYLTLIVTNSPRAGAQRRGEL